MKKLLLTFSFFAVTLTLFAQVRTFDWSTEEIISIDTMKSTPTGTTFAWEVKMKNNGPDTAFAGDSVLYQMAVLSGTTVLYAYPSNGLAVLGILNSTVNPGDTIRISKNVVTTVNINPSGKFQLGVITHVINRPNLNLEVSATLANNQKSKNIVWMNLQGWPVGVESIASSDNGLNIYPNPAIDLINFDSDLTSGKQISIMDITGKLMEVVKMSEYNTQINLTNYRSGIYLFQIKSENGAIVKSGKFSVSK